MESQQTRVLVQLRDLILKGAFTPGERLAEIPLAEKLGVSRTPVRLALAALEQEGLIEPSPTNGYMMRRFTPREIRDAIAVRGHLEGMAARLVAEHGVPRQLSLDLRACLRDGDRAVGKAEMSYDDYALYGDMNDRFHQLIIDAAGNFALSRAIEMNNRLPFASPSTMLPMQNTGSERQKWMVYAHLQHHRLVEALEKGEGARAQSLAEEHVDVAQMNLDYALERPDAAAQLLPAMKIVLGGQP
ncbi:putative HTH-type transcriptional regulator YdfH [Pigmentiphaga humi]|uniref:Putative HTH-type transcriptional regulator YdfH n=1 Tax=Pigmentiphaga humi TaxID=2478468 RepID=A0A3P4BAJ0_9BURK|nr:GntR family transcriptional regulator [Pigmentiphaga humi]VCU72556.1 putative HTH-type transcriptional regulator YdfH [Pigmentiphaga humi]